MGLIKRNSIISSFFMAAGYGIGILSALFIYSKNTEGYGYATFLYNTAAFLLPLASLGIIPVVFKFFPQFSIYQKQSAAFFYHTLLKLIRNFIIFIVLAFVFKKPMIKALDLLGMNENLVADHYYLIIGLSLIVAAIFFMTGFINSWKKVVLPIVINNFLYKVFLAVLIYLSVILTLDQFDIGLAILFFHIFVLVVLIVYYLMLEKNIKKIKKLFLTPTEKKELKSYANFSFFNTIGTKMAFQIDILMIGLLVDTDGVGKYGILFVLANIIDIPMRAINQIAAPIISELLGKEDYQGTQEIYQKSSSTLLVIGLLLFGMIWIPMDNILNLTADVSLLLPFKYVFFYLAIAKIVDMVTSVNSYVIIYSKFYRVNLILILVLGILNLFVNIWLINAYGIIGAAMATLISMTVFNFLKYGFIWWKFKMQVFNYKTFVILGIFALLTFWMTPWNFSDVQLINVILKSAIFSLLFAGVAYFMKVSTDLNQMVEKYLANIFIRK